MAGLNIPIGGDLAPFLAVAESLKAEMQRISKVVRNSTARAGAGGKIAAAGFKVMKAAGMDAMRGIATSARMVMGVISSLSGKIRSMIPGAGLLGPLAGIASIAGSIALAISSIKTGAEVAGGIEQTGIALEALTGSGEVAKKMMEDMKKTWLSTGASIEDQSSSIRKFIALGFSPEAAMKLQRNLMDVGGAVGMTTSETTLLASALAQVKAKGIVSMEELRQQIAEKGIPVFDALANKLGVTKGALIDMVSDGKVPAEQLLDIFMNMEGPFAKFAGGAERMGFTFIGMTERLKGAWKLFLAEFAAPILDNLKPIMDAFMTQLQGMKAKAAELGKSVGDSLLQAFALIQSGRTFELVEKGMIMAFTMGIDILRRGIMSVVAGLGAGLSVLFKELASTLFTPATLYGLKLVLLGIAKQFGNEIRANLPLADMEKISRSNKAAQQQVDLGIANMKLGTQDFDPGRSLAKSTIAFGLAAKDSFGEMGENAKTAMGEFKSALKSVSAEADKLRAKTAVPKAPVIEEQAVTPMSAAAKKLETPMVLTTALGRIGGGGFGMSMQPMVSEQRKTNLKLDAIIKNTGNSGLTLSPIV